MSNVLENSPFDSGQGVRRFLREDQIGNAGLAWSPEDCAGNLERRRAEVREAA